MSRGSSDFVSHELWSFKLSLSIPMFLHELGEHLLSPLDALTPVHLSVKLLLAVLPRRKLRVRIRQLAYKLHSRSVSITRYYEVNQIIIR